MPLSTVSGHRRLLAVLARSIGRDSLPPSLIFEGPRGVGKFTTAIGVAQTLNCTTPVDGEEAEKDACGACSACRRIAKGLHPDVRILEPGETGNIRIDQVREAIELSAYRPFEGSRRVVIIDQAESLGDPAQNALLKTLEEPRPRSTFILITARTSLLLPTVRSRCSCLRFGRLAVDEIVSVLTSGCGYTRQDAHTVAPLADGSVGKALDLRADDLATARSVAQETLERAAGQLDDQARLRAARVLVAQRPSGSAAADRDRLAVELEAMSSLLRDIAILGSRADGRRLANTDLRHEIEPLARVFDPERTVRAFSAVDRALAALKRNAGPKIVADWLAFQL